MKLTLFVAGKGRRTRAALANLERVRSGLRVTSCQVEVVDVFASPERAEADRVLATPMLVRLLPSPTRRIIGDLSEIGRVLEWLDLPAWAHG